MFQVYPGPLDHLEQLDLLDSPVDKELQASQEVLEPRVCQGLLEVRDLLATGVCLEDLEVQAGRDLEVSLDPLDLLDHLGSLEVLEPLVYQAHLAHLDCLDQAGSPAAQEREVFLDRTEVLGSQDLLDLVDLRVCDLVLSHFIQQNLQT